VVVVFLTLIRRAIVIVEYKYITYRIAAASRAVIFLASKNDGEEGKKRQAARTETGSSVAALRIAILSSTLNLAMSITQEAFSLPRTKLCDLSLPSFLIIKYFLTIGCAYLKLHLVSLKKHLYLLLDSSTLQFLNYEICVQLTVNAYIKKNIY